MQKRIGVVARTPTVQRGLISVLEDAGFKPVPIDDLEAWTPGVGGAGIVVVVRDDAMKDAVRTFCDEHPHIPVVGISPDPDVGAIAEVIRLGAITAVGEEDPTEHLVNALEGAMEGLAVLPAEIARAMAARVPPPTDPGAWVDEAELGWLRALTEGVTVPEIASRAGYSEREMFRILARMYQRIGVTSRTEAIVWATRNGLL
ncbi:MAG TPA: LuxR C-terminal-related transcriptional regulator [Acidimicrobiia bacterium]|nr:LuxR C-terminal-related transcriptional regulator [Acidimicrobiia bacterium]